MKCHRSPHNDFMLYESKQSKTKHNKTPKYLGFYFVIKCKCVYKYNWSCTQVEIQNKIINVGLCPDNYS